MSLEDWGKLFSITGIASTSSALFLPAFGIPFPGEGPEKTRVEDEQIDKVVRDFKPVPFLDDNGVKLGTVVSVRRSGRSIVADIVLKENNR